MCRTLLSGVYYTAQLLDVALESFAVNGTAFYRRAIVVDGARSIEEQCRNLRTLLDAQPYQSVNAQFGGEPSLVWRHNLLVGPQQGVEFVDKRGV